VRERIEYRFRVLSAVVFTLYSYSKALEYRFRVPTAGSLTDLSLHAYTVFSFLRDTPLLKIILKGARSVGNSKGEGDNLRNIERNEKRRMTTSHNLAK
jgi:hypothetical protein